jgi:thiamine-phosphate pyrophosphorylase
MNRPQLPRLHVIANVTSAHDGLSLVKSVLSAAGSDVAVQVRVKDARDSDWLQLASPIVDLCRETQAVAIVNDRADVAVVSGAHGVHLGIDDLPVDAVRLVVGSHRLIGGTARNAEQARELADLGADYLGVGPVYATTSKEGLPDPMGPKVVGEVSSAVDLPVIAIAGVTAARIPELLAAGAHGVAVIAAISAAPDPAEATSELLNALGEA